MSGMDPDSPKSGSLKQTPHYVSGICVALALFLVAGCAVERSARVNVESSPGAFNSQKAEKQPVEVIPVSHRQVGRGSGTLESAALIAAHAASPSSAASDESLAQLEETALSHNPSLRKLTQDWNAANARVGYVDGLPDPKIGANVFVSPIETAAGSQRANLTLSQVIPWLERLDAKKQQAWCQALELQHDLHGEKLRIIAEVRQLWFRLWFIERQIEVTDENRQLVKDLISVANSRVSTGNAAQGDVLAGTLQYARLEEQLVSLRQQRESTLANLNQVVGRPADTHVHSIVIETPELPEWSHSQLRELAWAHHPLIQSARIRTQATRWGIEMARLERRPEFSVSASWFEIDSNRPQPSTVNIGQDSWSLGATVSVPLWEQKYDAVENEARWKHSAAHADTARLKQQVDATLLDLWQQCVAAHETIELYKNTILPQARNTLEADQAAYSTGTVEFDRVVNDVRALLTLEIGYHRAVAQLATSLARIEQTVGRSPDPR